MKQLVSFHDMTDESEIDGVVAEIIKAMGQEAPAEEEPIEKHTPGGVEHEQKGHGNWSDGSTDDQSGERNYGIPEDMPQGRPGVQGLPVQANSVMSLPVEVPREDAAFVQEIYERNLALAGPKLDYIAENAGMEQMSVPGERRGVDTMGMHGVWEGDEFKYYPEERLAWQAEQLAIMEAEQAKAKGQLPGTGSKAVVMLGNPGSGKSHLIEHQLNEVVDTREYLTINADDIKGYIIANDTPPEIEGVEGDELSSMVHEESSHMRKVWEKTAMMKGTNIIFDITGANGPKTEKLLGKLADLGYEIKIVHADVDVMEAKASAVRRAVNGGDLESGTLGRVVPIPFIESMRVEGQEGVDVIDQNFDNLLPYASEAYWYRTFPLNVEREKGEQKPTKLLWSSK